MDEIRRSLLRLGVLTAASAALPAGAFVADSFAATITPAGSEYDALSYLSAADFKPFIGATFKAQSDAGSARVTLAEVQNPPALSGTNKTTVPSPQAYALRFKNASGGPLSQGTYVFRNSSLPAFAMFIVPSPKGSKPMYYTGHVNRSVQ